MSYREQVSEAQPLLIHATCALGGHRVPPGTPMHCMPEGVYGPGGGRWDSDPYACVPCVEADDGYEVEDD